MGFFKRRDSERPERCAAPVNECGQNSLQPQSGALCVKVLGSGCAKCNALETATREALAELGLDARIEHVTDFAEIAALGVMSTPALVVAGKVLSSGRVLKKDEVRALLLTQVNG